MLGLASLRRPKDPYVLIIILQKQKNILPRLSPLSMKQNMAANAQTKPQGSRFDDKWFCHKRFCTAFALAVTLESSHQSDWVARNGEDSLFHALECAFPEVRPNQMLFKSTFKNELFLCV
jgi:hypothetical protein